MVFFNLLEHKREWSMPDRKNMFSAYFMSREWSIPDSKNMFSALDV
jgi:hypothetical protein